MWFLFQGSIVTAFVAHNASHHWTPNRLVPVIIGFIAAWLATGILTGIFDVSRWLWKGRR